MCVFPRSRNLSYISTNPKVPLILSNTIQTYTFNIKLLPNIVVLFQILSLVKHLTQTISK